MALLLSCSSLDPSFDEGKRWGEPQLVEGLPADAERPDVAIDALGDAIAVWDQTDRSSASRNESDDIWSSRHAATGTWGAPVRLEQNEPGDSIGAQIAAGADGSVVVAFIQHAEDGQRTSFSIWAVRREPSGVWQPAECIQADDPSDCTDQNVSGSAARPQVAVDPQGDVVVVWQQSDETDGESPSIWANRFTSGSGWGSAVVVEDDNSISVAPQVAVDADGKAIVVWERFDGVRSSIFSKLQDGDDEWKNFENVESDDSGDALNPQIALDLNGNGIAVWEQETDGSQRSAIWSNRYFPSTGWGTPEQVGFEDTGDAERPQLAIDGSGNAIAIWVQSGRAIWSNGYVANSGWGGAAPIGPTALGTARAPQVASTPGGDAVAVWVQFDGVQDRIWANRYKRGAGWGKARAIDAGTSRALGPKVAIDIEGNAVAVWTQDDPDGFNTWSNTLE